MVVGSSPRVWGQVDEEIKVANHRRIIPTRVGTRVVYPARCSKVRDHPHACGDKFVSSIVSPNIAGSSPRVWGQVLPLTPLPLFGRIIPTRVGTSCWGCGSGSEGRDHPHACGDKESCPASSLFELGSSPRVWGQACFCFQHG